MTQLRHMVDQDTEGLRIAFRELLEEGFQRAQHSHMSGEDDGDPRRRAAHSKRAADQERRQQAKRTLASGYYVFAGHISGWMRSAPRASTSIRPRSPRMRARPCAPWPPPEWTTA